MSVPDGLKPVKPYFLRASEIEKSKHPFADIIAYSCRSYGMSKAFQIPNFRSLPGVETFLMSTMDKLEQDQTALNEKYTSDDGKLSKEKQKGIVKSLGLDVFKRADDEYKNGLADKSTALSFYSAAVFLEVGDGENEEVKKIIKIAKFKATEIMNAINSGREPLPPGYKPPVEETHHSSASDNEEGGEGDDSKDDVYGLGSLQTNLPAAPTNKLVENEPRGPHLDDLPLNARLSVRGREFNKVSTPGFGGKGSMETVEAEGYSRRAAEELKKDQLPTAIDSICKALAVLEKRTPSPRLPRYGLSEDGRKDVLEYLLFAARTLECAGQLLPVQDAKRRAADLLSNALQTVESEY